MKKTTVYLYLPVCVPDVLECSQKLETYLLTLKMRGG